MRVPKMAAFLRLCGLSVHHLERQHRMSTCKTVVRAALLQAPGAVVIRSCSSNATFQRVGLLGRCVTGWSVVAVQYQTRLKKGCCSEGASVCPTVTQACTGLARTGLNVRPGGQSAACWGSLASARPPQASLALAASDKAKQLDACGHFHIHS